MIPNPAAATAAPFGAALHDAKRALRERVVTLREALPAADRDAAARAIAARILALPALAAAHTVLLTLPFRSEWDTRILVAGALAAGKSVALPRVDRALRMLALHSIRDPRSDVEPGYRGIPEPRAGCPVVAPGAIEWVLVPGVAFDATGGRLGYGGGFYDRLLPLLSAGVPRVAGALELQVVDRVPAAPHDCRVDTIVTELRTITIGRPPR